MAPSPLVVPRKRASLANGTTEHERTPATFSTLTTPLIATASVLTGLTFLKGVRYWVLSGCGIESLAILYGRSIGSRSVPSVPTWTLFATLNLLYAICATSWLLYGLFTVACYPVIGLDLLLQFDFAADFVRRALRKTLRQLQFTRDKIAFFGLPALEIDTAVDGLFVIRGLTLSLSSLTLIVHGIELCRFSDCPTTCLVLTQ